MMADTSSPPRQVARPLSPHLQVYRWTWTMAMSIFHRATGCALYGGTLLLTWWLAAMATGPDAYARAAAILGSPIGLLVLFGFTWALMHHMLGGIRHLVWDTGRGFDFASRMTMARMTLVLSPIVTVVIWIVAYVMR